MGRGRELLHGGGKRVKNVLERTKHKMKSWTHTLDFLWHVKSAKSRSSSINYPESEWESWQPLHSRLSYNEETNDTANEFASQWKGLLNGSWIMSCRDRHALSFLGSCRETPPHRLIFPNNLAIPWDPSSRMVGCKLALSHIGLLVENNYVTRKKRFSLTWEISICIVYIHSTLREMFPLQLWLGWTEQIRFTSEKTYQFIFFCLLILKNSNISTEPGLKRSTEICIHLNFLSNGCSFNVSLFVSAILQLV